MRDKEGLMRALRFSILALGLVLCVAQGAAAQTPVPRGDISVVFVTASQPNDPFWNVVKRGAEDAGKDLGVKVQYIGSETFDLTRMVQNMEATIASNPTGIVVPIYDISVLGPAIQKAIDAGIPVVEIGSAVQPKGSLVTVGSDDYEAGKIAGQRIADAGATSILCVNSEPGNVGLEERCRGMADGAPNAKVKQAGITSVDPAAFQQQLLAALKADTGIDAVITSGPVEADLAVQALDQAGLGDRVKLATFDLSPVVLEGIDSGKILFALDQQQYLMGYLPVVFITNHATNLTNPVGRVLTGPGVVTKDTAKQIIALSAQGLR
jgi:simple sugar transport system substrate-binding protein